MNIHSIGRKAKAVVQELELRINQKLQRQYVSSEVNFLNIEISGICNLKCKFCAYSKKNSPKEVMSQELFEKTVNQAIALGYKRFELTPCTGDVFTDKNLFKKMLFLENSPGVEGYSFFTNLTLPDERMILDLKELKKLKGMAISVYGHDEESFITITKSNSRTYKRLLSNLKVILKHRGAFAFKLGVDFRSEYKALHKSISSELKSILAELKKAGVSVNSTHGIYNNWGGLVSQEDVKGLDMIIIPGDFNPKRGVCLRLLHSVQVTASGLVNACSCRDVNNQLAIGDINHAPLSEILHPSNTRYRKIIEDQESGYFRSVCKSCDFYKSIYHKPQLYRKSNVKTMSLNEYLLNPFPKDRICKD